MQSHLLQEYLNYFLTLLYMCAKGEGGKGEGWGKWGKGEGGGELRGSIGKVFLHCGCVYV